MNSIYIHIPFCQQKCDYCAFVSFANSNSAEIEKYISAIKKEINLFFSQSSIKKLKKENLQSIFIGGGTPNILSANQIIILLETLQQYFNINDNTEITIEVNPELLNEDWLVNICSVISKNKRLSIGVQSFNDTELKTLGRIHNVETAINKIKLAKKYFDNINIDIIYAIPGQTLNTLFKTLKIAISLDIQHLSAYSLSYEEGSKLIQKLNNKVIQPIDLDTEYEMYILINKILADNKFKQYEISNYSSFSVNKQNWNTCKHNLNYWNRGEYIGFGVAAHSFIGNTRFANTNNLQEYYNLISQNKSPIQFTEKLTKTEELEEILLLCLRSNGIDINSDIWKNIETNKINFIYDCIKNNYATIKNDRFVLTTTGKYIADEIVLKLLI